MHVLKSVQDTPYRTVAGPTDCCVHVAPPSVVRTIWLPFPTTVHVFASAQETLCSLMYLPVDQPVQVTPPSVVRRIPCIPVLSAPTVVHVFASVQEMLCRSLLPIDLTVQVTPPSLLLMNLPKAPTAITVWVSSMTTLRRSLLWGHGFCQNQ